MRPRAMLWRRSIRARRSSTVLLKGFLAKAADVKPEERPLLDAFFDEHVKERPGGGVMMDYTQETRWAVLCWRPL